MLSAFDLFAVQEARKRKAGYNTEKKLYCIQLKKTMPAMGDIQKEGDRRSHTFLKAERRLGVYQP